MNNYSNERYDEIKNLVKNSKMLMEQLNAEKLGPINVAADIEAKISDDESQVVGKAVKKNLEAEEEYVHQTTKLLSKILWTNLLMKFLT